MKLWPAWVSMDANDPRLQVSLETFIGDILFKMWEETKDPKPTYEDWWHEHGGGMETIENLIERLKV